MHPDVQSFPQFPQYGLYPRRVGGFRLGVSREESTQPVRQAPVAVGQIPDQRVSMWGTVTLDMSEYFSDPDGDELTYSASASPNDIVELSVADSAVTIRGVAQGTSSITVTARDPGGLATSQSFSAVVAPPMATEGDRWYATENWLTEAPLGEWHGITTTRNHYDTAFTRWLDGIVKRRVARCGADEGSAYLTQAVQSTAYPVPLVTGDSALLRVFVTARKAGSARIPPVKASLYDASGAEVLVVDIPGRDSVIPTEVNEGNLETSSNAVIPASIVQPGLDDPGVHRRHDRGGHAALGGARSLAVGRYGSDGP